MKNKNKSLRKLIFDDKSNVKEEIIFKDKIGRIRDIQIHPENGKLYFESDLKNNLNMGDKSYLSVLKQADEYIEKNRIVEFPFENLEKDIFNIVNNEDYKHVYYSE